MDNSSDRTLAESAFASQYREGDYLEKVPEWHVGDSPWKAGKVLEILRRNAIAPSSLCDVGCGAGQVLIELQPGLAPEARMVGFEISPQAVALCADKQNAHLEFRQCDFLTDSDETFDVLLLLDVFEHVPDYLNFISRLRGRARWYVFHIPLDLSVHALLQRSRPILEMRQRYGHLHYFTAETALATLADCGFSVQDSFFTWDTEIGGWPKRQAGLKGLLHYPLTCAIYIAERIAFRRRPEIVARLRKRYNLMVLATAS